MKADLGADMIPLVINTANRADKQITYNNLPEEFKREVTFVVQYKEYDKYAKYGVENLFMLPKGITRLSPTRQYIIDHYPFRQIILMDDDLSFFKKVKSGPRKGYLNKCNDKDMSRMFNLMLSGLDEYPQVGISPRINNNRIEKPFVECARCMHIMALDLDVLQDNNIRFDRVPCKQDIDLTLQLLTSGFKNIVHYSYAVNQSSNSSGGCSTYRTPEMMDKVARKLHKLYPDLTSVVQKDRKAWGGLRTELIVQWKKAYKQSQEED